MTQFLGILLKHLVSSFLISGILGFVTLTLMTGEFPPRVSAISNTFQALRDLEKVQKNVGAPLEPTKNSDIEIRTESDEALIADLQKIQNQRGQLGRKMLGGQNSFLSSAERQPAEASDEDTSREPAPNAKKVYEMQLHLSRMQNEIDQIKAHLQATSAIHR